MLITKEIIPKNQYNVRTNKGRMQKLFNEEYLTKVASVSNQMIAAGLKVPAPFDHNKAALPMTDEQIQIAINKPESSFNNAGYWKSFWVAPNSKGIPALYGQLDAAGDISDTTSPAYKVSNTNDEVSVSITDSFEDGLGRTWTDGIMHVAIVNYAVVPDQSPFDKSTIVNMSMIEDSDEPGSGDESIVEELKTVLRKCKINLPSRTNASTFMHDLLVAANQLPDGASDSFEPVPIYMSIGDNDMALTEAQANALVGTKAINPATSKPFTMLDLGFAPKTPDTTDMSAIVAEKEKTISSLQQVIGAFKNKFVTDTQASIQKRISALVATGIVTKEWADANLNNKVEFQMSIVSGGIENHPLEVTLSALETLPAKKQSSNTSFPSDAAVQINDEPSDDLSEADMEKALASLAADGFI